MYIPGLELEQVKNMARDNIKDIIAFGFDPEKTFIFNDTEYIQYLYHNIVKVQKHTTLDQIKRVFEFNDSEPVGKLAYPPIQTVPAFCNSFPHIFGTSDNIPSLIPCSIDQDPYFRMARDIAPKLKYQRTSTIYSSFFPALQGLRNKMSSSDPNNSILLTDSPVEIENKINRYAFSGSVTEEHKAERVNLDIDVPYQWLRFFLDSDDRLVEIEDKYGRGEMTTGEVKQVLTDVLTQFIIDFQERRKKVTDEVVARFLAIRKINPVPKKFSEAKQKA